MALKLRKDIKKSLYYVWFLGAKESKGLRGTEYIIPIIKHLEQREKDVEPFKVTLQVSHKGLKIIQNVVFQGKSSKPKNETIKHFIPHNTITCVYQEEDIISCILLLFNPVTKCPLHVHAYRCDSVETATLLKQQLQTLIESPENQKKFADIESKLSRPIKEAKKVESSLSSDTGTSTRESESSEERFAIENVRVTNLYDSVAAELRAKLGKNDVPILLPPRDYDTVHRQKGNLTGIELRRCLNTSIVGQNVKGRRLESSGGSSGIGSDHPPSPESPDAPDSRFNTIDNQSTSDEDWNGDTTESTLYLMHTTNQVNHTRSGKHQEKEIDKNYDNQRSSHRFSRYQEQDDPYRPYKDKYYDKSPERQEHLSKYIEKPISKFADGKYLDRQRSVEKERQKSLEKQPYVDCHRSLEKRVSLERQFSQEKEKSLEKDKTLEYNSKFYYHEKFDRFAEESRFNKYETKFYEEEPSRSDKNKPVKYFDDDGFDENIRFKNGRNNENGSYNYEQRELDRSKSVGSPPIPKVRQKYSDLPPYKEEPKYERSYSDERHRYSLEERYGAESQARPKSSIEKYNDKKDSQEIKYFDEEDQMRSKSVNERYSQNEKERRNNRPFEYYDKQPPRRTQAQYRQRTSSPEDTKISPRDRFKDAKEKFMLMEKERINEHIRSREEPIITPIHNNKKYLKRHESMINPNKYDGGETAYPKAAPRKMEEVRYRRDPSFKNADKSDPKRRSMFSLIEEEHRKNSNEIAKEIRRRSYLEGNNYDDRDQSFQELPDNGRYKNYSADTSEPNYDQKFYKTQKQKCSIAGYRHSYAEPNLKVDANSRKHFAEMLHRTNSSVSNNARVGIASIQPY